MAWLSTDYGNRKLAHWVNNNVLVSSYQVTINPKKSAGADSGEDVYLGSKVQDDFDDFRLTKADGSTLLDQWQEGLTSGTEARYWGEIHKVGSSLLTGNANAGQKDVAVSDATVFAANDYVILIDNNGSEVCKIASIAVNTLTMESNLVNNYTTAANAKVCHAVYLCYNNSSATLLSDGEDTFPFFDHFDGDLSKWAGDTSGMSVASSICSFQKADMGGVTAYGNVTGGLTLALRAYCKLYANANGISGLELSNAANTHRSALYCDVANNVIGSKDGTTSSDVASNITKGSYKTFDILVQGNDRTIAYENGVELTGSPKTTNPPNSNALTAFFIYGSSAGSVVSMQCDWVLTRNYTATLTWGAWGAEESAPVVINHSIAPEVMMALMN